MTRLEQLQKLVAAAPNDPLAIYAVGLELFNLGRFADAVEAFAQALAVDSRYVPAYYHKARAEIRAARPADARTTLAAGIDVAKAAGDAKTAREMQELLETLGA